MSLPVSIIDTDTGITARTTKGGSLAVGPISPSDTFNATLGVDNTPVEIVPARGKESFCITGIIMTGNKNIATGTDAVVTIYEATHADTATSVNDLFIIPIARSSQSIITDILIEGMVGHVIMGKTTDDDVLVTILGFYL